MGAKTIAAAKFRKHFASTLDTVNSDDVVIVTRRSKKDCVLVDIDKFEDLLAASSSEYLSDIAKAREEAKNGDILSMDEVFGNL